MTCIECGRGTLPGENICRLCLSGLKPITPADKRNVAVSELLEIAADPDELLEALTDYACSVVAARIRAAAEKVDGPARAALIEAARSLDV